jgi:nucleotide-binding universal stress UspA family protein
MLSIEPRSRANTALCARHDPCSPCGWVPVQHEKNTYVILAAVSLEDTADLALREAARSAQQSGCSELHVVHVVADHQSVESQAHDSLLHRLLSQAREELRTRVEALESTNALRVSGHIRPGAPVRGILQVAAEIDADVIVVGTHKRMGVRRFMLGSVAERVLREAHCPVLVAMRKDYPLAAEEGVIEPPCVDCLEIRAKTNDTVDWCERHSRPSLRLHSYEPSDLRTPNQQGQRT